MCRIILAMVAAYGRCFRAQRPTNGQGASKHSRTQVSAAELFYLRHLRSCAASASGSKSTSSGVTSNFCIPSELVMLEVLMSVIVPVVQSMLWNPKRQSCRTLPCSTFGHVLTNGSWCLRTNHVCSYLTAFRNSQGIAGCMG